MPDLTDSEIADEALRVMEAMRVTMIGHGMSDDALRILARVAVKAIKPTTTRWRHIDRAECRSNLDRFVLVDIGRAPGTLVLWNYRTGDPVAAIDIPEFLADAPLREEPMMTNASFAQHASFMAREISGWVGDTLAFADPHQPFGQTARQRFLSSMRERLDRIEHFESPVTI